MNPISFNDFFSQRIQKKLPVFFDGGMGTMIQASGITDYSLPEELNFSHPEAITAIHKKYIEAGADIITTNTFGCSSIKMADSRYSAEETAAQAVSLVKKARELYRAEQSDVSPTLPDSSAEQSDVSRPVFIAFDIGPTGHLLEPMGDLSFDDAYRAFGEAASAAEKAGADLAVIETMSDLYEAKAAILAVKEYTSLPFVVTMTFQPNLRMLTGADVETSCAYLESLRPAALGFNCGGSLDEAAALTSQFISQTKLPVMVQPNAGLPHVENGKTIFRVTPEVFAQSQLSHYQAGALVLGGCCGTTPDHIAAMRSAVTDWLTQNEPPVPAAVNPCTRVCSYSRTAVIANSTGGSGPVIIGERINPTGKKKCKEALLAGDLQYVIDEAESQIKAGAHILDINVGLPGIDEKLMMLDSVKTVQKLFDIPLQLDSSERDVLDTAMRYYNGKPLVNSVNGKQHVMNEIFPLVKKYGGCVTALCLDEDGIPPTAEGRTAVARKIISEAAKYGIHACDILIDTLTLTVSSQQKEAAATVKAIALIKEEFKTQGVKTVLGVSNISFGLPRRDIINANFFAMALYAGLDACIINPLSENMMDTFRAYRAIAAFDENCLGYIDSYAGTVSPPPALNTTRNSPAPSADLTSSGGHASSGGLSEEASSPANITPAAPSKKQNTALKPLSDSPGDNNNDTNKTEPAVLSKLAQIIIKGASSQSAEAAAELLKTEQPLSVINNHIVPALDIVGKDYETGRKFLPQLLLSAETVSKAFDVIKETLARSGQVQQSKGRILLATVHGDIHDIGKNIVKALLENYGYTVDDLGKDVPPEKVVSYAVEHRIQLIGLSALMTTTVASMEKTISLLRKAGKEHTIDFKIMAGGAVLTEDYAKKIGADFYSKDALASIAAARQVYNS